ncbi:retropepsin-like domain-containing protein [Sphingomonadaceae bacterium OTU29LAMAA1]|nr:retropepsin-like domain-containing protein [Sphingomonadaceae bacterium OTU29LAMAA1]
MAFDAERGGLQQHMAIETWLNRHPEAPEAERVMLAQRLCAGYGVLAEGARWAAACGRLATITGASDDAAIANAFRHEPKSTTTGSATVPIARNTVGLLTVEVATGDATSSWIVDTGAELTTVPESTATKLSVRMVEGSATIATSTPIQVAGRLGVIDTLSIGSARVRHVPVLVLPDAMLRLPDGSVMPGILGLPVLAAFRQVAWLDRGSTLCLGANACAPATARVAKSFPMYWAGGSIGAPVTLGSVQRPAQLDTGSNAVELSEAGFKELGVSQVASASERSGRLGGAGGILHVKSLTLPTLDFELAGAPVRGTDVSVNRQRSGVGRIGGVVINQLDLLSLDFDRMIIAAVAALRE